MESVTYQDWVKTAGVESEWGIKAIATDKFIGDVRGYQDTLGRMMGTAIARKIVSGGLRPKDLTVELQRDAFLGGTEILVMEEVIQGDLPTEYLGLAYNAWQEEQCKRLNWENKSLWQYIKYWVRRSYAKLPRFS